MYSVWEDWIQIDATMDDSRGTWNDKKSDWLSYAISELSHEEAVAVWEDETDANDPEAKNHSQEKIGWIVF